VINFKPTASLAALKQRSRILQAIRRFFEHRGILEVETPLLCRATVNDPHISSFLVSPRANHTIGHLQTSPEYAMKRLIAAGSGSIYQICKAFRCEEKGRYHNAEFTLLEWYRVGFNEERLMGEVDDLLQLVLTTLPAEVCNYQQLFHDYLSLNPHICTLEHLILCAERHGLANITNPYAQDRDFWLHLLMSHCIEPKLGMDRPIIVKDFPASQAALAQIYKQGNIYVAKRFEVYFKGIELANGYAELTDPKEQRQRFMDNNRLRQRLGLPTIDLDEYFLAALEHGLPDCAGVALGVDRLIMLAIGVHSVDEVISFSNEI
jgi:lysyl-tRNA synthetase class 2